MAATTQMYVAIEHAMADDSITYDETIDAIREIVGTGAKGRRIVALSTVYTGSAGGFVSHAACDDGSYWVESLNQWSRLCDIPQDAPAESHDPIAELEALGGRLSANHEYDTGNEIGWYIRGRVEWENCGQDLELSDLRAAAARLLARVRGAK